MCRFVGTALGIFGLASSGLGADLGLKLAIFGRILKNIPGPFSSVEETVVTFRIVNKSQR